MCMLMLYGLGHGYVLVRVDDIWGIGIYYVFSIHVTLSNATQQNGQ